MGGRAAGERERSTPVRSRRTPLARLGPALLALGSTLFCLALGEVVLRGRAHLQARGLLTPDLELPVDPLPGTRVQLGEMIRRSANRRIIYELRPNLRVVYQGAPVTTNAAGFRGPAIAATKPAGVERIVGIGDSFMFGQGVADHETHLARLEARRGGSVETANLAVPGYNAAMEVETLLEKGLRLRPDIVVIEFIGNDLDLPNFIAAEPQVLSLRRWFLADFVAQRLRSRRRAAGNGLVDAPRDTWDGEKYRSDPDSVPPAYRDLVGWPAVERAYRTLHAASVEHGFRLVLLRWDSIADERRLVALAESLGFVVLNLSPLVETRARELGYPSWIESPLVLSQRDNHPSAMAHDLVSEAVERVLVEQCLLPPSNSNGATGGGGFWGAEPPAR